MLTHRCLTWGPGLWTHLNLGITCAKDVLCKDSIIYCIGGGGRQEADFPRTGHPGLKKSLQVTEVACENPLLWISIFSFLLPHLPFHPGSHFFHDLDKPDFSHNL